MQRKFCLFTKCILSVIIFSIIISITHKKKVAIPKLKERSRLQGLDSSSLRPSIKSHPNHHVMDFDKKKQKHIESYREDPFIILFLHGVPFSWLDRFLWFIAFNQARIMKHPVCSKSLYILSSTLAQAYM